MVDLQVMAAQGAAAEELWEVWERAAQETGVDAVAEPRRSATGHAAQGEQATSVSSPASASSPISTTTTANTATTATTTTTSSTTATGPVSGSAVIPST